MTIQKSPHPVQKLFIQGIFPIGGIALLALLVVRLHTSTTASEDTSREQPSQGDQGAITVPLVSQPLKDHKPSSQPAPTNKAQENSSHRPPQSSNPPEQRVQQTQTGLPVPLKAVDLPKKPPSVNLRVAIATNSDSLVVGASTSAAVLDSQGHLLGKMSANQAHMSQVDQGVIRFGEWQAATALWIQPAGGGAVYVGDRWYRGQVQLVLQGEQLLAVNHVDLDQYLYSVVGGEMPAYWPLEALKAQAIAARSYALVHTLRPAHAFYDLGSTTRWQQYEGIRAEANTTQAAVNATKGLLLSYQGGLVESMYAATDEIVAKVFGGSGMSQTGAYQLAMQGYNHLHILGAYYPGSGLSQLRETR